MNNKIVTKLLLPSTIPIFISCIKIKKRRKILQVESLNWHITLRKTHAIVRVNSLGYYIGIRTLDSTSVCVHVILWIRNTGNQSLSRRTSLSFTAATGVLKNSLFLLIIRSNIVFWSLIFSVDYYMSWNNIVYGEN